MRAQAAWVQTRWVAAGVLAVMMVAGLAGPAFGHAEGAGFEGGFLSGLMHPVGGLDHVAAMVAVGLWGAFLGRPAVWLLPVVFPLVMAIGGALGVAGVPIPFVEPGIALSSVVIGLAIASGWKAPLALAAVVVGVFAVFHGHAHGTELPGAQSPTGYAMGFVISTGALHLAGIALGLLTLVPGGKVAVRVGGLGIAGLGVAFLMGWL
jgi:urease accessory protein